MTKQPKVSLISFTNKSIELMCWARRVMHNNVPDSLEEFEKNPRGWLGMSQDDYVEHILLKDGIPTFLEYVTMTWKIENVSRSLQQQLTRHRIGFSYSIQSLRCKSLPTFASDGEYYNPYNDGTYDYDSYHRKMLEIQELYNDALKRKVPTQDARGLLPMNVHSTITFSCSLRAFIGMINKRLCYKTQDEFRIVASMMVEEVKEKMDKRIMHWIGTPCKFGKCMMIAENEQQLSEGKFKGKQNTDHVCPKFFNRIYPKKVA